MKRFYVTVNTTKRIPGMGKGPIRKPTLVSENQYNMLKALGFDIRIVEKDNDQENIIKKIVEQKEVERVATENKNVSFSQEAETKGETTETESEVIEETPVEEVFETKEVNSNIEETTEETEDELVVNDPDLSADAYYEDEFLQSKNMCKKILDKRGVQYENKASFAMLKELVAQSNPEVEYEEEETEETTDEYIENIVDDEVTNDINDIEEEEEISSNTDEN